MHTVAIIVAAGQSRRMGFDKLFAKLGQRPVIAHSIQSFEDSPVIDEILVVTSSERIFEIQQFQSYYQISKMTHVLAGGRERHQSVKIGLDHLPEKCTMVAVHDGARPLISLQDIARCWHLAAEHGAAACARRIADTVKRADAKQQVTGSVDRSNLWAMETPQIFALPLLRRAYESLEANGQGVTDEVSAVESLGETIMLADCIKPNLKITYPQDLELAERLHVYTETSYKA